MKTEDLAAIKEDISKLLAYINQILYWFDDTKAGGSIAQQLAGMALECHHILKQLDKMETDD